MDKRIQFILPSCETGDIYSSRWASPLSYLSIATYSGLEIELIDAQITSQNELQEKIDCELLAGSINLANYRNFLKIARKYKEDNPRGKVIVGGQHSILAENILRNRECVDAVIMGDGEHAFTEYAKEKEPSKIPNLVYRKGGRIIFNPMEHLDLKDLPIPNRSLINLDDYFEKFNGEFNRPTTMASQRGCYWGKCIFCQVENPVRSRTPKQFWQEAKYLHDSHGVDYIWDVSDSPNKKRFQMLSKAKPRTMDVKLRFYCRTSEIDEKTAEILKDLNCYEIFLGIETGNRALLQKTDKSSSLEQSSRAVEVLAQKGIKPRISFVLGLPKENERTLRNSYNFAKQLVDSGADSLACSILTPVPDSKAFGMMLRRQNLHRKYANEDLFSVKELQKDWIKSFCEADYEVVVKALNDFENLKPENFGGIFR